MEQREFNIYTLWIDLCRKGVFYSIMKTANVADLRNNFAVIAAWIDDGETVAITKRGKSFAKLVPATEGEDRPIPKIDFAGRLRRIWGDRVFSDEEVAAMRAAEIEGEEG
jgi:antitoxin (DNA-binding transcriptional repressor) of toxin-antitoxin stability system